MELAVEEGHGSQTRVILAPRVYKGCKSSLIPGAVDVHADVHDIRALELKRHRDQRGNQCFARWPRWVSHVGDTFTYSIYNCISAKCTPQWQFRPHLVWVNKEKGRDQARAHAPALHVAARKQRGKREQEEVHPGAVDEEGRKVARSVACGQEGRRGSAPVSNILVR